MEQEKSTTQLLDDLQDAASFREYAASHHGAFLHGSETGMIDKGMDEERVKVCPFCGKALLQDAHFCPYCMQSFDEKLVITGRKRIVGRTWRILIVSAAFMAAAAVLGLLVTLI